MKKTLILLPLFIACLSIAGHAQITLLTHTTCTGSVCTTPAVNTTGATLIVCSYSVQSTSATDVCASSPSTTFTCLTHYPSNSGNTQICYSFNPTTSATQTFSIGPTNASLFISAYTGTSITSAVFCSGTDKGHDSGGSAVSSIQPGSITPCESGDLSISVWSSFDGTGSITGLGIDSSFTITDTNVDTFGNINAGSMAYLVTSSGAINPTWSKSAGTARMDVAIAAFRPATAFLPKRLLGSVIRK